VLYPTPEFIEILRILIAAKEENVSPHEWSNVGWIYLMGMLNPKLYTGLVGLPND
jgi:hypothetical protein